MTSSQLQTLIDAVARGEIDTAAAHTQLLAALRERPFDDLGFARVDHNRAVRQGFPEVILGLGRRRLRLPPSRPRSSAMARRCSSRGQPCLPMRRCARSCLRRSTMPMLRSSCFSSRMSRPAKGRSWSPLRELRISRSLKRPPGPQRSWATRSSGLTTSASRVCIVFWRCGASWRRPASSSSWPAWRAHCRASSPGWSASPVIAVPTSVGYGASFGGLAALLGMLNSCASGVSVVNIDNGFGAASIASLINHL